MSDQTYGNRMVFDGFFNAPDLPESKIGGWLVRGHDKADVYQEYVVVGKWSNSMCPPDWIDWIRVPIETGSALLDGDDPH